MIYWILNSLEYGHSVLFILYIMIKILVYISSVNEVVIEAL